MTIEELNKLKGQRAQLVKEMRALSDKEASGPLSADDQTKYAQMEKDFDAKTEAINRAENLNAREGKLRDERDSNYRADLNEKRQPKAKIRGTDEYRNAFFNGLIRHGRNNMGPEFLNVLTAGSDVDGGYLVPLATEEAIIKALVEQDMLRTYADVKTSALDVAIPVRTGIPTFGWIAENGTYPKSGPQYGKLVMHAHKSGGTVLISDELLQDSSENMEAEINETAGLAFGELESVGFAIGDGIGKPLGLFVPDSVAGVAIGKVDAASATAITSDEVIDLFHSITEPYRRSAAWVMRDATIKLIRKLKNATTGDYMWQPGLQAGQPDLLLGKPVIPHKDAPAATASNKAIIFGNLKAYRIRDRLGISVKPLNEAYAESGQVGFRFTKRTDGKLCDAKAVAYLKMHA